MSQSGFRHYGIKGMKLSYYDPIDVETKERQGVKKSANVHWGTSDQDIQRALTGLRTLIGVSGYCSLFIGEQPSKVTNKPQILIMMLNLGIQDISNFEIMNQTS